MTPRTFTLWMTAAAALLFVVPQVAFSLHGSSPPRRATATATDVTVPQKPNVVFIVTDDQPYYTMDVMPRTRALIGDKGVTFRNAFVTTPLCCPSRASILTGLFAHNHGVLGNNLPRGGATVFEDSSTVATWLQSAGYRTGYFGKYLNDYASMRPWPYVPPGWSDWRAMKSGCYIRCVLVENGVQVRYRNGSSASYSTHLITQKAVEFIEATPARRPLFAVVAPYAPHKPMIPAAEDAGTYATHPMRGAPSFNEADVSDKVAWVRNLPLLSEAVIERNETEYRKALETLLAVDRSVERIVEALQRTGRLDNTVLIFTSDNGFSFGEHRHLFKSCVFRECQRVPLMIRAPGVLPRVDDHLVLNVDFAPSIAEWARIGTPKVNGLSLVSLLLNPETAWRSEVLFEFFKAPLSRQYSAVRTDRWVYAEYRNRDRALYDVVRDSFQLRNLVGDRAYAAVVTDLQKRLAVLKKQ